jgi:hypothetical protein
MSLTNFKAKMNKSKINKYKINNNNKTNTKHESNVKYGRYQQDISKDTLQMQKKVKKPTFLRKHVSLSCLHFSLMFFEGEVKSPYFCKCGEPWLLVFLYLIAAYARVRQCVIIICRCPQNIIEISLSRKNVHRSMLSKMPEM